MSAAAAAASERLTAAGGTDWVVHKFGGTSLAAAECYAHAAELVRSLPLGDASTGIPLRTCVVVSAMGEVKGAGSLVAKLIRARSGREQEPPPREKVTNLLIRATELAAARDERYRTIVQQLRQRHDEVVDQLLRDEDAPAAAAVNTASTSPAAALRESVQASLSSDFDDLSYVLRSCWLSRAAPEHAWWWGYGELWSARIMQAYLMLLDVRAAAAAAATGASYQRQEAVFVDARDIVTLTDHKEPTPDYAASGAKLRSWMQQQDRSSSNGGEVARILVVTGYIASTASGTPTTLGRDGSDYSASIFAHLLDARSATIWTDVDGVFTANPGAVARAAVLPWLSYDEASELAFFGAKVLHPRTMAPTQLKSIPVWIRNTFNSTHQGTCIVSGADIARLESEAAAAAAANKADSATSATAVPVAASSGDSAKPAAASSSSSSSSSSPTSGSFGVRGFSDIQSLALVLLEGTGMVGVSGVCARLFGVLRDARPRAINVVLITQAGSEHSICLAVPREQGEAAVALVRREFRDEIDAGEIQPVKPPRTDVSCLAIVGDGMRERRGTAARMFGALARAEVNIIAIAQGSSERNISVIVRNDEVARGLQAVHQAFIGGGSEE